MQHHLTPRRAVLAIVATAAAVIATACSDLMASSATDATLSFAVKPAAASAMQGNTAQIVVTAGGHTLDLQSADVTFSEVTFEGDRTEVENDNENDDSDSEHAGDSKFRAGASTVSLPLQGGVITPFNGSIPTGTYDRLEMDAEFVRLRGTYDGQAFDVTVPVRSELELAFSPPLVVNGTDPVNVTVDVDVTKWLTDANGNLVDPRLFATDAQLREDFRRRMRASFKAFEDQDRDADESDSDSDGGHD